MKLQEAIESCKQGNFVTHEYFCKNQSMHMYKNTLYYEDGADLTNHMDNMTKSDWFKDGWEVKYNSSEVNQDVLKDMHIKQGHLMLQGDTYERCIKRNIEINYIAKRDDYEATKMMFQEIGLDCDKCGCEFFMKMSDYDDSYVIEDGMHVQTKDLFCTKCKSLNSIRESIPMKPLIKKHVLLLSAAEFLIILQLCIMYLRHKGLADVKLGLISIIFALGYGALFLIIDYINKKIVEGWDEKKNFKDFLIKKEIKTRSNVIQYDDLGYPLRLVINEKGKQEWLDTTQKEGDVVLEWKDRGRANQWKQY